MIFIIIVIILVSYKPKKHQCMYKLKPHKVFTLTQEWKRPSHQQRGCSWFQFHLASLWEELGENWKRKERYLKKKEKAIEIVVSSSPCLPWKGLMSPNWRILNGGEVGRWWGGGPENGIFNPPLDCPWQVGEVPRDPLNVTHLVKHAWDAFKNTFSWSSWGQFEYKDIDRPR